MNMRACALVSCLVAAASCAQSSPPPPRGPSRAPSSSSSSSARRAFHLDGFARPESMLYDEFHDRYLVSNINGAQAGFLSVVDPGGRLVDARFVDGDKGGLTLRDPHGMGILDGVVYVADRATVRTFY